jgi:hypothetical protein
LVKLGIYWTNIKNDGKIAGRIKLLLLPSNCELKAYILSSVAIWQ